MAAMQVALYENVYPFLANAYLNQVFTEKITSVYKKDRKNMRLPVDLLSSLDY